MIKTEWEKLEDAFPDIIKGNARYKLILDNILLSSNNKLLYTPIGFPIDLFLNLLLTKILKMSKKLRRFYFTLLVLKM